MLKTAALSAIFKLRVDLSLCLIVYSNIRTYIHIQVSYVYFVTSRCTAHGRFSRGNLGT